MFNNSVFHFSVNTKEWFKNSAIRAIKTVAQTAVGMLTGNMVGIMDVDWIAVASVSVMAGIVSILTSIAGIPEVPNTLSKTDSEQ